MVVLIQHRQGENTVYTKFNPIKPKLVSRAFDYKRDDWFLNSIEKEKTKKLLKEL